MSQSCGALIGYYCNCGASDWHNEYKSNLRSTWLITHLNKGNAK